MDVYSKQADESAAGGDQLPDAVYHDLIEVLDIVLDQREQVQPTLSFSEAQHVQDQTNTILERLEAIQLIVGRIVGEEEKHRRHVSKPARCIGGPFRSRDDE